MKHNPVKQTLIVLFFLTLNTFIMAQQRPYKGENDPQIFTEVRSFLQALNAGNGKPLEQLTPGDARQVLIGAQKSVTVDYSGIEESERLISQNGYNVNIHITKPKGAARKFSCIYLYPWRWLGIGRLSNSSKARKGPGSGQWCGGGIP